MAASGLPPTTPTPETISVLLVGGKDFQQSLSSAAPDDEELLITEASRGRDAYRWLTTQPGRVDCIVCRYDLPDMNGISLLESARATDPELPFVLVATDGSEAIASKAINADVTDYLAVQEDAATLDGGTLYERIQQAVADARANRTIRRRAQQFDNLFEDSERYMWVLAPDGSIRRTNRSARELADGRRSTDDSRLFWDAEWWADADETWNTVRSGVQAALEGDVTRVEVPLADTIDATTLDLAFQPIYDVDGAIETVVVEGIDISERTKLERELRKSEELHRVTLNNMTDTVLVTDGEGAFTYICPNVHFIFGYSVAELEEMGTVDELLGDDLFDREELETEGVLTNIETTATDRAGNEHTLLVNVREVSIQDGTLLYSCRDVTKRKERERALTALHQTSRELLYAETAREIAQQVVDDATRILGPYGTAAYRFDSDDNALHPVAWSEALERLHGPLGPISPREESIIGHAFVEQSAKTYHDVHESPLLNDPATDVRAAMVIPLGEYGVFVVTSSESDAFDEITEEIADLLAATAEAALDRIEREMKLRARDRELQRQNKQLSQLNRTNEIIRDIDTLLVEADSREEIEHTVCERLTTDDRFELAWIGALEEESGNLDPRAWAGDARGYMDVVDLTTSEPNSEPAIRTVRSQDPTVVANVGKDLQAGEWRKAALSRGYQSVAGVPLTYDGFTVGVLAVYAARPEVFDDMTRTVLIELGETIASAIRTAERKTALLSDTVTELEYRIADSQCTLYALAEETGGSLTLEGGIHPTPGGTRMLVTVDGPEDDVIQAGEEMVAIEAVRPLATGEDRSLLHITTSTPFVGTELSDHGAVLRSFTTTPTEARMAVDVPRTIDTHDIDDLVVDRYPDSELVAQRDRDRSLMTEQQFRAEVLETITDRQLEVVQTAYFGGYFDSPREKSGEEIADTLDISASAFYNHVRNVQSKLFATLFEQAEPAAPRRG